MKAEQEKERKKMVEWEGLLTCPCFNYKQAKKRTRVIDDDDETVEFD
jgi:hypothetical protein